MQHDQDRGLYAAKSHLSVLVEEAAAGEGIVIAKDGRTKQLGNDAGTRRGSRPADWRFTAADARIKLRQLCPSLQG